MLTRGCHRELPRVVAIEEAPLANADSGGGVVGMQVDKM